MLTAPWHSGRMQGTAGRETGPVLRTPAKGRIDARQLGWLSSSNRLAKRRFVECDFHQMNRHVVKFCLKVFIVASKFLPEGC